MQPTNFELDRQKSIDWAKRLLDADNFCIIDTETTGLGKEDQIIELGLVSSSSLHWQTYVKPTIPISESATHIHGITYEKVNDSSYFEDVFLNLWKTVRNRDIVIYNADFDLRLIRQSLKARGMQIAFPVSDRRGCQIFTNGGSIHCAMKYYSKYIGEWNDHFESYTWQKLPGGNHTALGDCLATLEIIKQMAKS